MTGRRTEYHKLVRDRIPEIIQRAGGQCETETLSEAEYRSALLDKLVEEAQEANGAAREDLPTELADVLEVIDTVIATFGLSRAAILQLQRQRRDERGGLHARIRLCWSESVLDPQGAE